MGHGDFFGSFLRNPQMDPNGQGRIVFQSSDVKSRQWQTTPSRSMLSEVVSTGAVPL